MADNEMFLERVREEYARNNMPEVVKSQSVDRADIDFCLALLGADEVEEEFNE